MELNELIKALKSMLPEKMPYGNLIGAEGVYAHSGPLVYEDPEPYFIEQAAAELKRFSSIQEILGDYDLDRLRELVEADKAGRCVVFPCKPSDVTVYQLRNKKHALGVGVHPRHIYCATVWSGGRYQLEHQGYEPCRDKDYGKTWFLKETEAEAELKKRIKED